MASFGFFVAMLLLLLTVKERDVQSASVEMPFNSSPSFFQHVSSTELIVNDPLHPLEDADSYSTEDDIEEDMRLIMKQNFGRSSADVSETLYKYLTDKYPTNKWLVIVYDSVRGFRSNILTGSTMCHAVFREGHKNAIAFSLDSIRSSSRILGVIQRNVSYSRQVAPSFNSGTMACKGYRDGRINECARSGRILMALISSSLSTWKHPININGQVTTLESILNVIC